MHRNTILAASGLVAAAQVLAAPAPLDNDNALLRRDDDDWEYKDSDDGNTRIRISDHAINFGAIGIDEVVQNIKDECTDVSCGSGGKDIEVETKIISSDNWNQIDRTIKMHASGSFANKSPGTRNDLVDMAERVLEEFVESELKDYTDVFDCPLRNSCESLATGDTRYSFEATEYTWPDEIHIRIDDDNGHGTLDITFEIDDTDDHDGICELLAGIGGDVAGAVSAPTGPLFSLFGLGCTAASG